LKPKQKSEKKGVVRRVIGGRKREEKLPTPYMLINKLEYFFILMLYNILAN